MKMLFKLLSSLFIKDNPKFKILYTYDSFTPVLVCPKCGSTKCIEQMGYYNIEHVCLDCKYIKTN